MKRITAILLAALLIVAMAVPVLAEEAPATETPEATEEAEAEEGFFTFADGCISGSYEGKGGLIEIYVNDQLAGSDYINKPVPEGQEGLYTVKVYENGALVAEEEVQAGALEPVVDPENPGEDNPTDTPEDPAPTDPTPADPTPEKPADNSGSNSGSTTPSKTPASNVPKTGDAENMGTFMVLGLGAALTLAAAKRVKSR